MSFSLANAAEFCFPETFMSAVSLVIPCRNESARLPRTLEVLGQFLESFAPTIEVVVVVEQSSDNTVEIAKAFAVKEDRIRVIANSIARGKGYAVKTGMLAATGDIVFFSDADLSVPLRFIPPFLEEFEKGADVVFGSRQHPDSVIPISQPFLRVAYGRLFNFSLRAFGATRFKDTQCGFKAFRREAAQWVFSRLTIDGFGFDVEALALADAMGYSIRECPVEWSDAPGTKVRALRDGAAAFAEAIPAAWRARKFRPTPP